jgi:hypothetical protein
VDRDDEADMNNLILEIGCEEIPAGYILPALTALSSNLLRRLDDARIEHGGANPQLPQKSLQRRPAFRSTNWQ